jgi:non-specific serine/threonine protein kinase
VDLATLTDGAQVPPALARALGLALDLEHADAAPALAAALGGPRLLVLDNAEHLREAVAELLSALFPLAPGLQVLVTTQAPLGLPQERVQLLEPLPVASADAPPEQALRTDAIGLLVARACAADNRLRIGPAQLPTLRALCSQLDGLPLALEMAASRVPLLGLQGVHEALAERFALLRRAQRGGASRHQTLHAALSWSYALLPRAAQQLFRQLGTFAGGFTLELMLAVAGDESADRWVHIDHLATLVDHSLVATLPGDAGQAPRYRLLETMQAFAAEQLRACGEAQAVQARHARAIEAFLRHSLAGKDASVGDAHARLITLALAEFDNARKAWHWAIGHDVACAASISAAAAGLATTTPWRAEVLGWMQACEALLDDTVPLPTQALWWNQFAHQLLLLRSKRGSDVARRACDLAQASGDDLMLFWSTMYLARSFLVPDAQARVACDAMQALLARHPEWPDRVRLHAAGTRALVAYYAQDFAQALLGFQDEQEIAERLQLRDAVEVAECNAIALLLLLGRQQEGVAATRIALQRMGQRHSVATAYLRVNLLDALVGLGQVDEATCEAGATWQLARRFDAIHTAGEVFAKLALAQGRPRAAARLHGHWRGLCAQRNITPEVDANSADLEARIRSALADIPGAMQALEPRMLDEPTVERLLLGTDDAP